ncbi:MAG: helix-turn-helix domain-containing protein [Verrucomicrobiia bacterium]
MNWTASKIHQLRRASGMTQKQFADWLGVTRAHVSHLEGYIRSPGPQTVRLLDILAGQVKSGEWKAVKPKPKERRSR